MCKATVSVYKLHKRFPDANAARVYLENRRWSGSPVCPLCASNQITTRKRIEFFRCRECKRDFTVRTGTIFAKSKVPLHKWFYTIYLLMTARKSVSSLQLSKEIGVTQKTAWFMAHRIRAACGGDFEKLKGVVEIDETYIGGKEKNKHARKRHNAGRGAVGKQAVLGMRERDGRVKAKPVARTDMQTLNRVIGDTVEYGATVYTDDCPVYDRLHTAYKHATAKHSAKEYVNGMAHTNGIESVWAVLKRGVSGTYHNISTKHLARYVDEFTFRLNEGCVKNHIYQCIDSVLDAATGKTLTYQELLG